MSYYSEMKKGKHSGMFTPVEYAIWLCGTAPSANDRILEAAAKELAELRERGDRLEAMIDRMAGTIVDLRMALATVKQVYEEQGWTTYRAENGELEINPTYETIRDALQLESGLTKDAPDRAKRCPECGSEIVMCMMGHYCGEVTPRR